MTFYHLHSFQDLKKNYVHKNCVQHTFFSLPGRQSHQLFLMMSTVDCIAQHYNSSSWAVAYDPESSAGSIAL